MHGTCGSKWLVLGWKTLTEPHARRKATGLVTRQCSQRSHPRSHHLLILSQVVDAHCSVSRVLSQFPTAPDLSSHWGTNTDLENFVVKLLAWINTTDEISYKFSGCMLVFLPGRVWCCWEIPQRWQDMPPETSARTATWDGLVPYSLCRIDNLSAVQKKGCFESQVGNKGRE